MLSIVSLMGKKQQNKEACQLTSPDLVILLNHFNQICWVSCPFDLWKGRILTPCCFKRPLTPGCNLMECMPTTEKGQQVTRVTLKGPRGKWPLDTGPSASSAAERRKCSSSGLPAAPPALQTGVNLKREEACLRMRHGIHIYTVYASREDVCCKRDVCEICACVHGRAHAHVWACECASYIPRVKK